MPVKPNNVVPAIGDKIVNAYWDFSADSTQYLFVDADTDYDVVEIVGVVTVAVSATAALATLSVGNTGVISHPTYGTVSASGTCYLNAQTGPTSGAVGAKKTYTVSALHRVLPAGSVLKVTRAANSCSDTGEMLVQVRLRPKTAARGNASKRPVAAQSTLS